MEFFVLVFISTLLFHSSDAGSFTWLRSDDTVNVVEGGTAKLNWSVRTGTGNTWAAVKITRSVSNVAGPGDVDIIRRKPSGVEILLPERGADMDLDVQANLNVLNVTFTLRNLSRKTDEMYYRISVVDNDYDTSSLRHTKLFVDVLSSCKIYPGKNITVIETDNVSLNVTTTGNPPVYEYIWTHPNGSRLTANSRLTFTASRQDTGTYKVSVYNGVGDRSICKRHITVQFPSSCTIHPDATTVKETDKVSLNVTTPGNPPVYEYIWTHPNGSTLTADSTLTFTASRQDTGTYKVSVYNGFGDRSICTSNVTVQYPPVAVTSKLVIIENYQNGSINCSAPGEPEPTFYWTSTTTRTLLTKDNGRTVVLINATLEDTGNYTCTAKNSLGDSSSTSSVIVAYLVGCTISPDLPNVIVNESGSVTLTCVGKGQPPVNEFFWTYPNGTTHPGTSVLQYRASRTNIKIYHCLVRNSLGRSGNCTRKVTVHFPSSCEIHPNTTTVKETDKVSLNVTTTGNPPVYKYIWTHPTGSRLTANSTLTFNASRLDTGTYKVSVHNGVGDPGICTSNVTAQFMPRLVNILVIKDPQSTVREENGTIFVYESDSFNLACESHANPEARYKWTVPYPSLFSGLNQQTLLFNDATTNHSGRYVCTAINIVGEASSSKNLSVYFLPESTSISISPNLTGFCLGSLATISCTSYAKPPAKYSLYHNTKLVHDNSISGVFKVTLNELGKNYICVPYNTVGFGQNRSLELLVKEPPKAENCKVTSENMINGSVVEGERVTLSCIITGSDPLNITWTNGSHVWNQVNLTIDSVNRENTGNYHVTVNNGKECNETKGKNLPLIVYFPSSCEIHSDKNITLKETEKVSLNVTTTGNPPVYEYIWTHPNGSRLTANSTLTFTASRLDTGTYKVSVHNGVGDRGICTSNVAVQYFGDLTCEAVPVEVKEGDNIALNCSVTAYPPASYTWNVGKGAERGTASNVMFTASRDLHNKSFTCTAENSRGVKNCSTTPLKFLYLDPLEVIGSSNKSYSQPNSLVLFNLSINAYPSNASLSCNPSAPNILTTITSHDAGLTRKQYLVVVIIQNDVDNASIVCKAENSVGVRERTLHFYRQPIFFKETFTGQFKITNQEWQDDLKDTKSVNYNDLKQKCIKILEAAYLGVPYLAAIRVKDFIKGSIIVRFELEVIGQVPDPLLPLRDYIKTQGEEISGLQIDYNSIQKSNDLKENTPIPTDKDNKTLVAVLGVLFALSIVLNIIFIAGFLWLCRRDSKGISGKTSNKSDERGQMNDISLQETSFNATDNETPNVPEYEPIKKRGLSTSNAGIPEYEAVTTRTRPHPPHSGVRTNYPMPQYEGADQHRQTEAVSNPPPVTYQTIQPRTGNYDSLSPFTRLPPKGTVLSSIGSPTRTGEYQALQHKGVSPQYQSLDDLSKC